MFTALLCYGTRPHQTAVLPEPIGSKFCLRSEQSIELGQESKGIIIIISHDGSIGERLPADDEHYSAHREPVIKFWKTRESSSTSRCVGFVRNAINHRNKRTAPRCCCSFSLAEVYGLEKKCRKALVNSTVFFQGEEIDINLFFTHKCVHYI